MKIFEKNSQLDEMQEKKLLNVESRGFWGIWIALLAALMVQSALGMPPQQSAAEWIIFMLACLYMAIETLRNGIWDRHFVPTTGANIVGSLLGGVCFAVYLAVWMCVGMPERCPWWLVLATSLTGGLFVSILIFAFLQLGLMTYRKRRKSLEAENDDGNDSDNEK